MSPSLEVNGGVVVVVVCRSVNLVACFYGLLFDMLLDPQED